MAQLCDYFEGMAEERGITLVNAAHGTLHAEPQLLRRALANLIANALRYGSADSPVQIDCTLAAQGDAVAQISVSNHGAPIAAEHLPRLFDRFYRCDPARAQPGDSGGLGLAIVRSILQMHGGTVQVESGTNGTRFVLIFKPNQPLAQ